MENKFWDEIEKWSEWHNELDKIRKYSGDSPLIAITANNVFETLEKIKIKSEIILYDKLVYDEIFRQLCIHYQDKVQYQLEKLDDNQVGLKILLGHKIKDDTLNKITQEINFFCENTKKINYIVLVVDGFRNKNNFVHEELKKMKEEKGKMIYFLNTEFKK